MDERNGKKNVKNKTKNVTLRGAECVVHWLVAADVHGLVRRLLLPLLLASPLPPLVPASRTYGASGRRGPGHGHDLRRGRVTATATSHWDHLSAEATFVAAATWMANECRRRRCRVADDASSGSRPRRRRCRYDGAVVVRWHAHVTCTGRSETTPSTRARVHEKSW